MNRIVVGYDESEAAERALQRAAEIAEGVSARLTVVSVSRSASLPRPEIAPQPVPGLPPPAVAGPLTTVVTPPAEPVAEPAAAEEPARRLLERARRSLASRDVETEYVAEVGDAAERLVDVADVRDADLLVIGSRTHGLLERVLGDPVDEAVKRRFERDVLLVH